ncbi:unnamed protein product [Parajaminaea phylloscopi]
MDAHSFDAAGTVHQEGRRGEPLNAEPSPDKLTSQLVTPQENLYRRNHGDIVYQPSSDQGLTQAHWHLDLIVDRDIADELDWTAWKSDLPVVQPQTGDGDEQQEEAAQDYHRRMMASSRATTASVADLQQQFPERSVVAAMECAGNRRGDMSKRGKQAEGIQWNQGTIGNALWQGASLREYLLASGVPDPYAHHSPERQARLAPTAEYIASDGAQWSRDVHIHFLSAQPSAEPDDPAGQSFGSSLPLATAMHPNQDVLLCWAASRQQLGSSHGYPLRVVIPGHVAARWVKWLRTLRITRFENDSPPMKDDYKVLEPPRGASEAERAQWLDSMMGEGKDPQARRRALDKAPPLMRLGVGSGLSTPTDHQQVRVEEDGAFAAEGYAVGTEGSPVDLVELVVVPDEEDVGSGAGTDAGGGGEASLERLRLSAQKVPASQWVQLRLDGTNTTRVLPKAAPSGSDIRVADVHDSNPNGYTWSWTLWKARVPAPDGERASNTWALVVRCTTAAGVQQELQSPWNVRGFRERSWPVVRGLRFASR